MYTRGPPYNRGRNGHAPVRPLNLEDITHVLLCIISCGPDGLGAVPCKVTASNTAADTLLNMQRTTYNSAEQHKLTSKQMSGLQDERHAM